ncbi:uncharacterized protein Z518_05742 [Rhinocladiella mackenziei CBS 650.93]|uniref:Rhinocladiella mackenziei CBS 650.93 unplaced genomic scaffold supercont1.4, whole genome shotgun sequence n=1 Tax=Rhinocladiella mackenziei CBS 650.93 TaxID=1442369 RepID=A0A0D2IP00_9EURO|nr:uncharacterized protein Z518_05742 [Rhinocladiella mackenziei CBS 650.93]KIX04871.1 hypothetical protein Z518_05742 [Rhinocladiella mackenziei CBS 650.93]
MNLEELTFEIPSTGVHHHAARYPAYSDHSPSRPLKAQSLSSTPSENDWVSPFTLPPLPSLRRDRHHSENLKSPEYLRQRDGSGAYYAAAWGSPYATPSPRRTPGPAGSVGERVDNRATRAQNHHILGKKARATKPLRKPRSERTNWLSESEDSEFETSAKEEDKTPTRVAAYLDSWGTSPVNSQNRPPRHHRVSESLATITPDTFHDSEPRSVGSDRRHRSISQSGGGTMAAQEPESVGTAVKPLSTLPRRGSLVEEEDKVPDSPSSTVRPRPTSMQSYQRPKKKVFWKGKACIIALPMTDREAAGLPPVLTAEQVKRRIDGFIADGYNVDGFELNDVPTGPPRESSGQSRPVYPDPTEMHSERKLRHFQVHIPNQAEWESWVNYLKEEKLRALGVSPSNSEAPPSTRSPFSPTLSRVSSSYPGLAPSPPVAPSSSASNPLRATSNPFSPSLVSSAGISPQPGSVAPSQFNGLPKSLHGYKQSMAQPNAHGRMTSPFEHSLSQSSSFGPGVRPNIQPLSSRQNSFSPNHPLYLPNLGEVLSPASQPRGIDVRGGNMNFAPEQGRHNRMQSQDHILVPQNQPTPNPALPQRIDNLVRTPDYNGPSRPPIEIAHPTPKSHRHNLSVALQREIDEAEAVSREEHADVKHEAHENLDISSRKDSTLDESLNDEPPILRRPETITAADERSEIETNPSIAATPMLMEDKDVSLNWQALSDAAKAEPKSVRELTQATSKLNVEAKEFDPRAGFSSSNPSFGGDSFAPFGLPPAPTTLTAQKPASKTRFSVSHLNADAPAFTPSFILQEAPKESTLKPAAATFNVDAPVFNPSLSPATNFNESADSVNSPNSVFGNANADANPKATKASKAVPIMLPKSKDIEEKNIDWKDVDGQAMTPADRQKRERQDDSDGDRSPHFADSAPFNHSRILSEIVDNADTKGPTPESPKKPLDGWSYIPAEETQPEDAPAPPAAQKAPDESREHGSDFTFKNQRDAAMFNEAIPPLETPGKVEFDKIDEPASLDEVKQEEESPVKTTTPTGEQNRKPKSSLSALAKPFEFKPHVSSPYASSSVTTPKIPQVSAASPYGATPSPEQPSALLTANHPSPPHDLHSYRENEGKPVPESPEARVEVTEENSVDDEVEPQQGNKSPEEEITQILDNSPHGQEDEPDVQSYSLRHQDEPVPSFEEIDAVMKHLEVHPELGVERNDTPIQSTPLVDMHLSGNFRSDAPSPSPPRTRDNKPSQSDACFSPSFGLGIGVHNLNTGTGRDDVSDWGDALPAAEEAKLQLRSQFFDGHVNDLVGGILENRLGPLERTLQTIQDSLALMTTGSKPKSDRRSMSTDPKDSDADDEDDYDAYEGFASYRTKSPMARRGERKQDKIRAAVTEALAAYQPPPQPQPDLTELSSVLQEMRQLAQQAGSQKTQSELKTIMEDVISHHPHLRGSGVQQDHETAETKVRPQIDGLESMLKISKEHATEESKLRRESEKKVMELELRLKIAEEEAAQYRETMRAFVEEKESYKNLEDDVDALTLKNTALETTLEEYRVSSDQWRSDIRSEREKNVLLKNTLRDLHQQLEDQSHSRQALRAKVERVQAQMTQVVQDLHAEQGEWRQKEHSLLSKLALTQGALEQERRRREKVELELDSLEKEHKANLHAKTALEQARLDISRLNELVVSLRKENRALDTKAFNLNRELAHTLGSKDAEIATATAKLQAELDSAKTQLLSIRTDSEARISRLQSRLDHAELDIEDQKAKHDALLSETIEAHKDALREADEKRESALEDQHQMHEKKLNDLRDRHTRELHNSFDNRTRLEHQLNERLSLSDDKVKHLERKVADLEERLEITKSAARAAVEAATAKGVNLPTPAPSVVASPPQRAASASMSFAKGSEVPEKISPQALRESIMVLQDQLQNREQKIEQLESQLAEVDREAPNKLKERDTEIGWLRELLSVRIDDLEDIINTVSQPDFDRITVKDAAIRLKANLQMEQQLKERAASGLTSSFPSISALQSYAQSPRALPMAAAAAWGNWRRARDSSIGAISDLATNTGNQTPSRSTIGSPASFLSGIITPPSTSQKQSASNEVPILPPTMKPLAAHVQARKAGSEARPLRSYSSQPRALSSRQLENRPESSESQSHPQPRSQSPHTPIQFSRPSLDLAEDVDEDASPLERKDTRHLEEAEPLAE